MTESGNAAMSDEDMGQGVWARIAATVRRHPWITVLLLLLLLGFAFRRALLILPAAILDVGEPPVTADFIYLLNGGVDTRPFAAAELYFEGYAPRVVIAHAAETRATLIGAFPNESDVAFDVLRRSGVPDSAVVVLTSKSGVSSTADEGVELRRYLERTDADTVLVVTNGFHTRRARWHMRRNLRSTEVEVRMFSVPDARFTAGNWWRSEAGMLAYFQEYLKFLHNWAYRAAPAS
ncbi:MAG: YdcF family protein [Gemmatimonadota bacterium]